MSFKCRTVGCANQIDHGQYYCDVCGGRERAITEGLAKPQRQRPQRKEFKQKIYFERRGAPVGQGLSKGVERSPEELAAKRKADIAKKTRRDERRKKLLAAQPEGRKGQGGKESVWGTGRSKDARRRAGKKRKNEARGGKRRKNKQKKQSKK